MNLFDLPDLPLTEELATTLAESQNVWVERIVSTGQTTGWYNQEEAEFVALLQGFATLEYENGETVRLAAGDTLIIPPHKRHRVFCTSAQPPCVWLCVFWKE